MTGTVVTVPRVPAHDAGGRRPRLSPLEAVRRPRSEREAPGTPARMRLQQQQPLAEARRCSNRTAAEWRAVVETLPGSAELEVTRMGTKWQRVLR